jgi:hypothetical protein
MIQRTPGDARELRGEVVLDLAEHREGFGVDLIRIVVSEVVAILVDQREEA